MSDTALMVPDNLSHNVLVRLEAAKTRLSDLANVYLVTEVAGQSQATLDAKRRDLQRFLSSYQHLYGHDRPEEWFVSVTKAFLRHLQKERLAQASLVRIYATVRHFSRWLHRKFPDLFPLGCPTDGVKPPAEPTAEWKGLTRVEEIRLLSAAQTLRVRSAPGTDQGLRNHTLLCRAVGLGSARLRSAQSRPRPVHRQRLQPGGGQRWGGTRLRAGAAQRVARCHLHYTCNCLSSKQLPLDRQ